MSAFLNSAYSYFWDCERDWEIKAFTGHQGVLPLLTIRHWNPGIHSACGAVVRPLAMPFWPIACACQFGQAVLSIPLPAVLLHRVSTFLDCFAGEQVRGCIRKPSLPSKISYWPGFYYYLMASNLVLRLSWTYKLSPHLRHNHATVMGFTLLEAFRRFQWMFVRVEVSACAAGLEKSALWVTAGFLCRVVADRDIFAVSSLNGGIVASGGAAQDSGA